MTLCRWVSVSWCSITSPKTWTLCIFLSVQSSGIWSSVVWLTYTDVSRNLRGSCFWLEYGKTSGIIRRVTERHVLETCIVSSTTVGTSNLALYTAVKLKQTMKIETWPLTPLLCVSVWERGGEGGREWGREREGGNEGEREGGRERQRERISAEFA
jgi:hypothetical protein